jgi:hypothetical protein
LHHLVAEAPLVTSRRLHEQGAIADAAADLRRSDLVVQKRLSGDLAPNELVGKTVPVRISGGRP